MDNLGPYELLVRIGVGGMGEVWKARGPGPDGTPQVVVVKRILAHLASDPEVERGFLREVRLAERLDHPNIVRVHGGGRAADALYLTMAYLEGVDLSRLLRALRDRGRPPPIALGVHVARGVCAALAYAHDVTGDDGLPLRLVHRDVTPTNIMITRDGRVVLLDFGLAKALAEVSEESTRSGTLKGKFSYMAPEQFEGASARHHSDQFSLGIVLHEALTAQRLFRGEHDVQTIGKVRALAVAPPSAANPAVPPALDRICLRALARDPRARFRDCAAMGAALDEEVATPDAAGQVAALVAELFPAGVGGVRLALPAPAPAAAHVTVVRAGDAPVRSGRWRVATIAGACVLTLAVATGVGMRAREHAPAAPSAAPSAPTAAPSAPPVPAATAAAPPTPTAATPTAATPAPRSRAKVPRGSRVTRPTAPRPPTGRGPRDQLREQLRQGAVVDPFAR